MIIIQIGDALSQTFVLPSIQSAANQIIEETGLKPIIALTGPNFTESDGSVGELAKKIKIDNRPCLLLFGTGWGLHNDALEMGEFMLDPIFGANNDYNHLSVRSAVAIYLSQLCSELGI